MVVKTVGFRFSKAKDFFSKRFSSKCFYEFIAFCFLCYTLFQVLYCFICGVN